MKRVLPVAFLWVSVFGLALAQNTGTAPAKKSAAGAEQQIKQLEQQIRSEVIKGDASGLERYEADDSVNIDGSGMMADKKHAIQMLKDGSIKYSAIDVKEERIRTYGNTAIYNGLANTKLTVNGKDYSGDYRVTIVWTKLNGQWKRVSFQATPVMAQAAK